MESNHNAGNRTYKRRRGGRHPQRAFSNDLRGKLNAPTSHNTMTKLFTAIQLLTDKLDRHISSCQDEQGTAKTMKTGYPNPDPSAASIPRINAPSATCQSWANTAAIQQERPATGKQQPARDNCNAKSFRHDTAQSTSRYRMADDDYDVALRLDKLVRLKHHAGNWTAIPQRLKGAIDNVVGVIKPPSANGILNTRLLQAAKIFGENIALIVQDHLRALIDAETTALRRRTCSNIEAAVTRADTRLAARYKSLKAETRHQMLDEAAELVGSALLPTTSMATLHTSAPASAVVPVIPVELETAIQQKVIPIPAKNRKRLRFGSPINNDDTDTPSNMEECVNVDSDDMIPATPDKRQRSLTHVTGPKPASRYRQLDNGIYITDDRPVDWTLEVKDHNKCIVLADNNVRSVDRVPDNLEVYCMPRACIRHAADAISRWQPGEDAPLIKLAVHVGFNNTHQTVAEIEKELDHLMSAQADNDHVGRFYTTGIPMAPSWDPDVGTKVRYINSALLTLADDRHYVTPQPTEDITVVRDGASINRLSSASAQYILTGLSNHITNPLFL